MHTGESVWLCASLLRVVILLRPVFLTYRIPPRKGISIGYTYAHVPVMVLEKYATADQSPSAVKIEERIGLESLWENALVCGERCMRKIRWLVKALYMLTNLRSWIKKIAGMQGFSLKRVC